MDLMKVVFAMFMGFFVIVAPALSASYNLNTGDQQLLRNKRDHGHGITGPVHTYVKTDKHANFKWGVRHHVGKHYSGN